MLDRDQIEDWGVTMRAQSHEFATDKGAKEFAFGLSLGGAESVKVDGFTVHWLEPSTD